MLSPASVNLDSLYREHGGWLVDWPSIRSRSNAQASDLAQETLCRLAAQPELKLHSHPRRYLATVARRLLIDDRRRQAAERSLLGAWKAHAGDGFQPGPDRVAEAIDELMAMMERLAALPSNVQRAFAHCYMIAHGCPD